jgi:hypothetical protein
MRGLFKDKEHLLRMAALFAAGVLLFVVARGLLVPASFGVYGHFRADALLDNRARPLAFAGRAACSDCHGDVVELRVGSKHAKVGCEACHGALGRHAGDPEAMTPEKPDGARVCLVCHLANVAKPRSFPQVDPAEHGDGQGCGGCHKPHHPEIGEEGGA